MGGNSGASRDGVDLTTCTAVAVDGKTRDAPCSAKESAAHAARATEVAEAAHATHAAQVTHAFTTAEIDGDGLLSPAEFVVFRNLQESHNDDSSSLDPIAAMGLHAKPVVLEDLPVCPAPEDTSGVEDSRATSRGRLKNRRPLLVEPPWSKESLRRVLNRRDHNVEDTLETIRTFAPNYMKHVDNKYSFGISAHPPPAGMADERTWSNPLETALPAAKRMVVACMYGVNKPTERSYAFRTRAAAAAIVSGVGDGLEGEGGGGQGVGGQAKAGGGSDTCSTTSSIPPPVELDSDANVGRYRSGIRLSDGDGTLPLESLGLMCVHPGGWNGTTPYNPGGLTVRTKEYWHDPFTNIDLSGGIQGLAGSVLQGGPRDADHVNILGNELFLRDILRLVTAPGHEGVPEDEILSDVRGMAERTPLPTA